MLLEVPVSFNSINHSKDTAATDGCQDAMPLTGGVGNSLITSRDKRDGLSWPAIDVMGDHDQTG